MKWLKQMVYSWAGSFNKGWKFAIHWFLLYGSLWRANRGIFCIFPQVPKSWTPYSCHCSSEDVLFLMGLYVIGTPSWICCLIQEQVEPINWCYYHTFQLEISCNSLLRINMLPPLLSSQPFKMASILCCFSET